MNAKIDWKAFHEVNNLSTTGLMSGEEKTLSDDEAARANAALLQARKAMLGVQDILETARLNWRHRHLTSAQRSSVASRCDACAQAEDAELRRADRPRG